MYATAEGTGRYEERFSQYRENAFYRSVLGLNVSSVGAGTYLGRADDQTDRAYTDALIVSAANGINFFDTAINYRGERSERCIGAALKQLQRDEVVVCTKAGFLTPGAVPALLNRDDVVGGMHSMAPDFLVDQIDRSRANMRIDTIDVFYLHNPETQLGFIDRQTFEARILRAFQRLEQLVDEEKIRWYGTATWDGYRKGALSLPRIVELAIQAGGPDHHFRWVQLPFNLAMVEAFVDKPESILQTAARLGIAVVASAPLLQTRVLHQMPDAIAATMPDLRTPAQRAIQFSRSTPGVAVAIVGMSRREHVLENLEIAGFPPLSPEGYLRIYQ